VKRGAEVGNRPLAVDLFSGAGGLSLGFEQAGFDVVASVEYDPIHTAVHRFNFPRTEAICADAAALTATRIRDAASRGWRAHGRISEWAGEIDVVIGGPPCQGFSLGGKREFDDPRNQLVFTFARLVGALNPRFFVMENVPGMGSMRAGEDEAASLLLEMLVEEMKAFGYAVAEPQILNAAAFGVPQDRRRLLLVGARAGETLPARAPATTRPRTRQGDESAVSVADRELRLCPSVWDAIGDLPDLDDYASSRASDEISPDEAQLAAMHSLASPYAQTLSGATVDPSDYSWPRAWDAGTITSSFRTVHAPEVVTRFAETNQGHAEPISRLFRLHRDGVSSTLRAGTHYERGSFNAPRPIHPELPRVISVREAARLHSFPDWFRLHWTKWHGFREVGNALPPRVGRAVGAEILQSMGVTPTRPSVTLELGDTDLLYLENLKAAERFSADTSRIPRNGLRYRRKRADPVETLEFADA
jgi:DNA (cytosine-5)-methyltransferase 1